MPISFKKRPLNRLFALCCLGLSSQALAAQGSFQQFLDTMRAFESGIDPAKAAFYRQNLDQPVYNYAKVTAPGQIIRDPV